MDKVREREDSFPLSPGTPLVLTSRSYFSYAERFLLPGEPISASLRERLAQRPVYLHRALKSYSKSPFGRSLVEKVGSRSHTAPAKDAKKESVDGEANKQDGKTTAKEEEEATPVKEENKESE